MHNLVSSQLIGIFQVTGIRRDVSFEPLQLIADCASTSLILKSEYNSLINGVSELLSSNKHPLLFNFLKTLASCDWSLSSKPLVV